MTAAVKTSTAWVNMGQTEDKSKPAFVSVSAVKGEWATPIYLSIPNGNEALGLVADIIGAQWTETYLPNERRFRFDLLTKAEYATTMEINSSELKAYVSNSTGNKSRTLDLTDKDRFFAFLSEIHANRRKKGATRPEIADVIAEFRARHDINSHRVEPFTVTTTAPVTDDDPV